MQLIKNSSGATRGYIVESSSGDRIDIFTPSGKRLGFYLKSTDKTFNASGAYIGSGNQLNILLEN